MLVYKCDGESYSTGKKCVNEVNGELPKWWLSIEGKIKNRLHDAHIIQCDGLYHFCSRECLENFLFKDVTSPAGSPALNNMNTDPNAKATEATNEQATEQESAGAAAESAAQDQAMEANENAEEGGSEG